MTGKNIIYICNYAANYSGNFIASLAHLAMEVKQTNNVFFVFPEEACNKVWLSKLTNLNDSIFFCSFEPKELYRTCKKLSKLSSPSHTIVHTHFVDEIELLAVKACFKHVLVHYHMTVPKVQKLRSFVKKIIMNLIYRNVVVIAVSEAVLVDLQKYFYLCKHDCVTNAIAFEELDKIAERSKQSYPTNSDSFSILIHGTHFQRKGVDIAIKALESIDLSIRSKSMLYITSHNLEKTRSYVSDLGTSYKNIQIIDVVEDIKKLYDSVDLFISPSRNEAFGYAVAEASYSECQVLASDVPGQNTMKDIPGILWVNSNDYKSLKDAIEVAFMNKASGQVAAINQTQKEYVLANYNIDTWVYNSMILYDKYFG